MRVTPDVLLSELPALQGGLSLGRATTKLLIFFFSFTFFQVGYIYPCFSHGYRAGTKLSLRLVYGLALPVVCLQNGVIWRNDLETTKMVATDQMWHFQPTSPK